MSAAVKTDAAVFLRQTRVGCQWTRLVTPWSTYFQGLLEHGCFLWAPYCIARKDGEVGRPLNSLCRVVRHHSPWIVDRWTLKASTYFHVSPTYKYPRWQSGIQLWTADCFCWLSLPEDNLLAAYTKCFFSSSLYNSNLYFFKLDIQILRYRVGSFVLTNVTLQKRN